MRSMCNLFRAPLFTLLIVLYNSVYCNYILLRNGWLVGLGIKAKRGFALAKGALWPRGLCGFITLFYFKNALVQPCHKWVYRCDVHNLKYALKV